MPSPEREKLRYLGLIWGAMLGPAGFHRLVNHFGSTAEALAASLEALRSPGLRLTPEQVAVIPTLQNRLEEFESEMESLREENIAVLCAWEPEYPALLGEARNPPPVVCIAGRVLPEDEPAIAIVGTRSPTEEGAAMTRGLARAFAEAETTVVSGLARGCDTAAHVGALEGGGRTIAVLGSGIRVVHPRENLDLARDIFERGAVISEQPPTAHPTVGRLMARNRLQSALCRGVLVVESGEKGGAMETARRGIEQSRAVCAVKWPEPKELSRGPDKLLREGARAVTGPEDVPAIRLELVDHIARMERHKSAAQSQRSLFEE